MAKLILSSLVLVILASTIEANLLEDLKSFVFENTHLQFEQFVHQHNKPYRHNYTEKAIRYKIFIENLNKIRLFNQNEQGTAVYGVTEHADLTYEEFRRYRLGYNESKKEVPRKLTVEDEVELAVAPDNLDWREKPGVVTEVKNQGMCGSCWAFSATGNIEGVWAIKRNASVSLSEQELIDCDKLDNGCGGGLPTNAYKTIIKLGGIETETDYPYEGENEKCKFNSKVKLVKISGYQELPKNETYMKNYLATHGPISIGINANAMQFYFGGISHPANWLCDPANLDHGVLIVGYGVGKTRILHRTLPYWIIKNSWGRTWGEKGYYRVYRGGDTCGLSQMASSAVVN